MRNLFKPLLVIFLCGLFSGTFSGCATFRKGSLEKQELRNQVQALEAQLRQKDDEIASLKETIAQEKKAKEESAEKAAKPVQEVKSRPNFKQIQTALKNAGYNPGAIDSKMGRQTRDAIRAFQKANGLEVDGKAGKETWKLLRQYLYQKVK